MRKLRAAVVGLGQAGSRFDEEPRGCVWSHVGAYLADKGHYELVAGVDVDLRNLDAFSKRCPSVPQYASVTDMVTCEKPEVVSIATPSGIRKEIFDALLNSASPPRLIICEKPLATDVEARNRIVELCASNKVTLLVHYNRRYNPVYQALLKALREGKVGDVLGITIRCPNRLWSIGSHAFDLLFYLSEEQPENWHALPIPLLAEGGEPAVDFVCTFPSGKVGRVAVQGSKDILIFEVDVVGTKGRMLVTDNGSRLTHIPYKQSAQYLGYRVQGRARHIKIADQNQSTFTTIVREAASVLSNNSNPTCSGRMAMQSEYILDLLNNEAKGLMYA